MPRRALIVEDNTLNVQVLAGMLAQEGFEVTSFTNPKACISTLDEIAPVDIAFIDLEMPLANGFEVARALQKHPAFATVPLVAYTVHVSQFTEAYQAGFHSFVAKPLDANRFPSQLARILSGEHVWERM